MQGGQDKKNQIIKLVNQVSENLTKLWQPIQDKGTAENIVF